MMEKKWNNGIVEECKDEKKMECWVDWSSPNIPLFQHSNCLWGYPLFQHSKGGIYDSQTHSHCG